MANDEVHFTSKDRRRINVSTISVFTDVVATPLSPQALIEFSRDLLIRQISGRPFDLGTSCHETGRDQARNNCFHTSPR